MMASIGRLFVRGLLTVLPVMLTAWLLVWLGSFAEASIGAVLEFVLPEGWYLPGMGLVAGFALICLIGLLTQAWLVRKLLGFAERRIEQLPVIKSIYGTFKDFASFFQQDGEETGLGRPVLVDLGGTQLIGFVTNSDASSLGAEGALVVYLPMGYQIGGYTVLVPRDAVRDIESLNTQEAMRYAVTAGITGSARPSQEDDGDDDDDEADADDRPDDGGDDDGGDDDGGDDDGGDDDAARAGGLSGDTPARKAARGSAHGG